MAKKSYLVRQERKFNGDTTVASFTYECDETEIAGVVALLEGKITVLEENVTLSSAPDTSTVVTGGLVIDNIAMVHSEAKTVYLGAYNRLIIFKATTSVTELQNVFKLHKPFNGSFETETPDEVYPRVGTFGNL